MNFVGLKQSVVLCAMAMVGFAQAQVPQMPLVDRSAQGDPAQFGQARRISADQSDMLRNSIKKGQVKNVILLIGDGMGDSEITAARNYAYGAAGFLPGMDALPITGQYTHYSLDRTTHKPNYVTDSAAAGTAIATGSKTYNGGLGVDVFGQPHASLLELAKAAGKATGNVTTAEIQDATPAAQIAHVEARKCYGPQATSVKCPKQAAENGGAGSISEQLLKVRPDVTLGGGMKSFEEVAKGGEFKGEKLIDAAKKRGYQVVTTAQELESIHKANDKTPVLGLFTPGNLPVLLSGPDSTLYGSVEKEPVKCVKNPAHNAKVPTLEHMTQKAIELLQGNSKGFFLQVEGASIDKAEHSANSCGHLGETLDLDRAVKLAIDFAKKDGNTLVVVTSDHGQAVQIIPAGLKAPGLTQAVMTADGVPMALSYATSIDPKNQEHTGTQLRIAAYGPGAANFTALTDQTDLFFTLRDLLGLKK